MTSNEIVARLLKDDLSSKSELSKKHLDFMFEKSGSENAIDLVRAATNRWVPGIRRDALECFGVELPEHCEIVISPSPMFNAECVNVNGKDIIVLHEGVMCLISFSDEIKHIVSGIDHINISDKDKADYKYSLNYLSTMLTYRYFREPFTLPNLSRFLTSSDREAIFKSVVTQEMFIVLHEFAHNMLKHNMSCIDFTGSNCVASEDDIRKELEADNYAIEMVINNREVMLAAALTFFGKLGLQQSCLNISRVNYPSIIRRLQNIKDVFVNINSSLSEAYEKIIRLITEDQQSAIQNDVLRKMFVDNIHSMEVDQSLHDLFIFLKCLNNLKQFVFCLDNDRV